ncbi:MAG: hypothetical protein HY650_00760 [Acidobacteria bacterium]|nr:hypothetical protein [Acidobacteriota bacterium]
MRHEQLAELLALFALGIPEVEGLDYVRAHLAKGCASCELELREMDDILRELALTPEPLEAPEQVRSRLLARIPGVAGKREAGVR